MNHTLGIAAAVARINAARAVDGQRPLVYPANTSRRAVLAVLTKTLKAK